MNPLPAESWFLQLNSPQVPARLAAGLAPGSPHRPRASGGQRSPAAGGHFTPLCSHTCFPAAFPLAFPIRFVGSICRPVFQYSSRLERTYCLRQQVFYQSDSSMKLIERVHAFIFQAAHKSRRRHQWKTICQFRTSFTRIMFTIFVQWHELCTGSYGT